MGLYIAGLRMPKPGTYTKFTVYGDGRVVLHFGGKYVGDAVEVKKPHGRLIDGDALKEIEFHGMQADKKISYQMGWNDAIATIAENAPTIIEAEKETE